jgi:hypothetical protein
MNRRFGETEYDGRDTIIRNVCRFNGLHEIIYLFVRKKIIRTEICSELKITMKPGQLSKYSDWSDDSTTGVLEDHSMDELNFNKLK